MPEKILPVSAVRRRPGKTGFQKESLPCRARLSGCPASRKAAHGYGNPVFPCLTGQKSFSGRQADHWAACRTRRPDGRSRHSKTACAPGKTARKKGGPDSLRKTGRPFTASAFPQGQRPGCLLCPVCRMPTGCRTGRNGAGRGGPNPVRKAGRLPPCLSIRGNKATQSGRMLRLLSGFLIRGFTAMPICGIKTGFCVRPGSGAAKGKRTVRENEANSLFRPGKRFFRKRAPV